MLDNFPSENLFIYSILDDLSKGALLQPRDTEIYLYAQFRVVQSRDRLIEASNVNRTPTSWKCTFSLIKQILI